MTKFIFDCGSGNSCKNSIDYACKMVKAIADLGLNDVTVKWQLFKELGKNTPLSHEVFERAYRYGAVLGLRTTASVFDKESLDFLMTFGVPFIKLANNKQSQAMLDKIPESMPVVYSTDDPEFKTDRENTDIIYCVSKYPADLGDYYKFGDKLSNGLSDHTTSWALYQKHSPKIYECHFKLADTTGLDAGSFARLPENIKKMNEPVEEKKLKPNKGI
jgi:sialic acid synthase SpsE